MPSAGGFHASDPPEHSRFPQSRTGQVAGAVKTADDLPRRVQATDRLLQNVYDLQPGIELYPAVGRGQSGPAWISVEGRSVDLAGRADRPAAVRIGAGPHVAVVRGCRGRQVGALDA